MNPRTLTPEMQAALDKVEKPGKRGKKTILKKEHTEDTSTKPAKSKKRKADKGDSSVPKKVEKWLAENKLLHLPIQRRKMNSLLVRKRKNTMKVLLGVIHLLGLQLWWKMSMILFLQPLLLHPRHKFRFQLLLHPQLHHNLLLQLLHHHLYAQS